MRAQSGLPNLKALRRERFRKWIRGYDARLKGESGVAPRGWNEEERSLFYKGWRAAREQEREIETFRESLERGNLGNRPPTNITTL
jgi:ribosome modulation factor